MLLGYAGTILYIDLTTGKTRTEKLNEETAKKYVGGLGLGTKLWLSNSKARVDPLSPENPLVLAIGPVSGTMFPTGGNGHVFVSKSPATGGVGAAVSHGTFGAELKRAGYDAIVFTGKSEKPVYIWIDDESIQLIDAANLWGKSPGETEDAIKSELGDYYVRVASIGLAGEKQSKIACIINEKTRAAGRGGLGAVMGSKNLKAIAVRGTHDINVAKLEEFMDMVKEFHERMKGPAARKYRTLGSVENILINNELQCMPTNNYNNGYFQNAEKVSGEVLNERYVAKIIGCNSCAMRCEHEAIVREGPYKDALARMEYDNLWALGPNCGVDRLDSIIKAAERCTFYGLDAQSVGVAVSFLMDCFENGLVSAEELGGVDAHFGNGHAVVSLVERIGKREGVGELLADGVRVAAERVGEGADRFALHVKGLEVTGYDLRCLKTTALASAVSFRGADHNRSGVYAFDIRGSVDRFKAERGRGKIVKDNEDIYALIDSLIVCKNSKSSFYKEIEEMTKLYNLVTGLDVTTKDLAAAGERIMTLTKLINLREGFTREDDTLPWKIMNQPIAEEGPAKGAVVSQEELDLLLDDYYQARGWLVEGIPTKDKLKELGLQEFASIIEVNEA
ncbi:MAG: aldehyde ferredoxin oxidoreductase family protein [Candidatus Bathyarchaeota archaeon]|nr:aldehyde ferredoxin oxidoreductase family protein [Candidatus Bathyarchaeota archaeon]MDD4325360.1 aldehyde ferredoxin oxidoreductase family protein [Candidatus Bathyarchaeota archaeon]